MSRRSQSATDAIIAQAKADAALMLIAEEIRYRRAYDNPGARIVRAMRSLARTVASGGWE